MRNCPKRTIPRALLVFAAVIWCWSAQAAPDERARIALLVGNQAYDAEIGRLNNPLNDVALLHHALKQIGFEVTVVTDAGYGDMARAINAHARRLRDAGPGAIGFLYYSGHGAQNELT